MSKNATDELRHEHEVVLVVVGAMEAEAVAVRAGDPHAERIAQMVDFTKNFTDGCHHAKEEKALFPLLEDSAPEAGGPVSVMLSEHEAGRQAIRAIEGALPDVETSAAARDTVATGLATYAHLLRLHIRKENEILFPMAERLLGDDDKRALSAEFERLEQEETGEGVHERYHALAHELGSIPA